MWLETLQGNAKDHQYSVRNQSLVHQFNLQEEITQKKGTRQTIATSRSYKPQLQAAALCDDYVIRRFLTHHHIVTTPLLSPHRGAVPLLGWWITVTYRKWRRGITYNRTRIKLSVHSDSLYTQTVCTHSLCVKSTVWLFLEIFHKFITDMSVTGSREAFGSL